MDGKKLLELRKSKGMTRRQVEDATGVSQATIQCLETCKYKNPNLKTIKALAECYGVTMAELIADD